MRRATEKDLFGRRGGAAAVQQQQRRLQASANGGIPNKESQLSRASEVRKVEAAVGMTGMDISQKYDAFGNNSFSSADNPWLAFFGAPTSPWKTTSYDKYDRHNYSLPEAYVGQNKTLAQTIDELIYTEETFYTTELLPYSFTDQISVAWDKWVRHIHGKVGVLCTHARPFFRSSMSTSQALCQSRACRAWCRRTARSRASPFCAEDWLPFLSTASW